MPAEYDAWTDNSLQIVEATQAQAREALRIRKRNYGHAFLGPAGQEVLADLVIFCRGVESCWNSDPRAHAAAEGRREVWLRIQNHLNLTAEQLYVLYSGGKFLPGANQQPPADEGTINYG